jgi:hypothetical protein
MQQKNALLLMTFYFMALQASWVVKIQEHSMKTYCTSCENSHSGWNALSCMDSEQLNHVAKA